MENQITEKQLFEAFGLGEQGQEPADPATADDQEPATGGQAQEVADPAQGSETDEGAETPSTADAAEPGQPEEEEDTEPEKERKALTAQQRKENAARRRQAEMQQAVDAAVAKALQQEQQKNEEQLQSVFAMANIKNPKTGEIIKTMDELRQWSADMEQEKLNRELKAGKLTAETLAAAIGNHPAIKQANALIAQDAQKKQTQAQAEAKAKIDEEIAQIHAIDESINTAEDLLKAPYGKELYAMVQRGYSLKDAHYLLNRERLENAKLEAARQQAQANARGKEHLNSAAAPRGGGSVTVPKAELELFRLFNPAATDAQIQAYYNQNLKK